MDKINDIIIVTMFVLTIFGIIGCRTMGQKTMSLEKQAVILGFAEYNKTNGNWQWITNK